MARRSAVTMKIRFCSIGSLTTFLGVLSVICMGSSLFTGCTSGSGSGSAPPVDEKALKAQYQAEAEKQINEKNADEVLSDLEKEIDADSSQE
jgi:hypothetical protein